MVFTWEKGQFFGFWDQKFLRAKIWLYTFGFRLGFIINNINLYNRLNTNYLGLTNTDYLMFTDTDTDISITDTD